MAAKSNTTLLAELAERFDPENEVGQRTQGGRRLDYIGIDKTISRYNKVLGPNWSFTVIDSDILQIDAFNKEGKPVKKYLATVTGEIEALGKRAGGVGADVADDPDKAIKTALAEALKKASHQFGTALYLWNEDERNIVQQVRQAVASGDDLASLKIQVMQKATDAGVAAEAQAIADHFEVTLDQLQDIPTLERILSA